MNAYVDTLAEWYENAERISHANMPNDGDTIMYPNMSGAHTIEPATFGWVASIIHPDDDVRILHRAPKPKPAWHNAVAVIAHVDDFRGAQRRVFVRRTADFGGICWEDEFSEWPPDELIDPVPLIEAKVTDEMVKRGADWAIDNPMFGDEDMRKLLHAALGLETA